MTDPHQPFRLPASMPVQQMKTYSMAAPVSTHRRKASCQEVDCEARLSGWQTQIDVSTDLGRKQANYIRIQSKRGFTVAEDGTIVTFTFYPGQDCFQQHTLPLFRDPLFSIRDGDWRGNPTGRVQTVRAEDWIDDCQNTLSHIADIKEQG